MGGTADSSEYTITGNNPLSIPPGLTQDTLVISTNGKDDSIIEII